ncbi:uncharacterized protein PHA67_014711 isoform 2-T2 [Liasis olivaceus]
MSEGVTYADLQFARSPPEKSQQEEPNEGELTYENVQGPWAQEEEAAGGPLTSVQDPPLWPISCHLWSPVTNRQMLGALTVFLFLLAASIGLGIQCLQASQQLQQVSRQLQQASQDHVAEQHVLGEELHALRVSLEESQHLLRQAQEELNSTAVALWESQAAENQTRRQLQRQGLLLTQANHSLALLQTERESAEASLSQATSCQQIGCCAPGWTLFRWRCLQASTQKKTWEESADACKRMTSQLLVLKPWSARELWEAVGDAYGERELCLSKRFRIPGTPSGLDFGVRIGNASGWTTPPTKEVKSHGPVITIIHIYPCAMDICRGDGLRQGLSTSARRQPVLSAPPPQTERWFRD